MRSGIYKRTLWLLACCIALCGGCGSVERTKETAKIVSPVEIPVIFRVDPVSNQSDNELFVKEFNEAFAGSYVMKAEWLTESTSGYRTKLKQWNVLDELPVLITDAGFDHDFYEILAENERLVDLRPYMEESDFWMDVMRQDILEDCTEEDGSIYLSPLASSVQTFGGIIYNEELLKRAGYDSFPKTWEEFWECMDDLKEAGIIPLALHGSGTYWVPMLFATAYLCGQDTGEAFLREVFPASYQNDEMEAMMNMLRRLFDYTYEDALSIDYDQSALRFINGEAAVIANGKWMFDQIEAAGCEHMRFAPFPGNVLMNEPRMSAWAVTKGHSEEVTLGAVKALEFRIQCEQRDVAKIMNEPAKTPLFASYREAVQAVETVMPNYQLKWEQEIQNEFFAQYMPEFLEKQMGPNEFLALMDAHAKQIQDKK